MLKIKNGSIRMDTYVELSWKLEGDENQKTYEIQICDADHDFVWSSGVVNSNKRHNIKCAVNLPKENVYEWNITCVGSKGTVAHYQGEKLYTGVEKWIGKWMEPSRNRKPLTDHTGSVEPIAKERIIKDSLDKLDPVVYFRKEFILDESPKLALGYAAAHGIYAMYINGTCVSDLFAPGNTSYEKHIDYQSYDVTPLLKAGKNVMAFSLADGWFTGKIGAVGIGQQFGRENAVLGQLMIKKQNQEKEYVVTDEDMRWSEGALRYSDLYIGEYYDADYEVENWNKPEYEPNDTWKTVCIKDYGYDTLKMQTIPGIKVIRTIHPTVYYAPNGDLLLDAGENIVGFVSVELESEKGQIISMEHSETLDANGNYIQNIIGQNKDQTDFVKASKPGILRFKPQFSYHGFRYVRVKGTADLEASHYLIHVIGTPLCETGIFTCSDERLNILQENIKRSQLGNMISIPTDCPQRERTGWLGDMQIYAPTGCYEYDIENFIRHWMMDVRNEQLENGEVPHIVPYMPSHDIMKPPGVQGVSAAGWSDAAVIVPWRLYEAYGDKNILRENFGLMKSYMDSTEIRVAEIPEGYEEMEEEKKAYQKYLWNTGFQYGDWLMPSVQMSGRSIFEVVKETGYIVATLMYALTTEIMAEICEALEKKELQQHYLNVNKKVREAFAKEYIKEDGTLMKDYQGVYVLALKTRAIPEDLKEQALNRLVRLIKENHGLLDTGFLSVAYLLPVLKENGQRELANELLFQEECPSWLYEVKMGATTMWEYWNGYASDGTPNDCSMNHFAFGCVGEYLYHDILGIQSREPGFSSVVIDPDLQCGLDWVKGSYESILGSYEVAWKKEDTGITLKVIVPPDGEALIPMKHEVKTYPCGEYHIRLEC